MTVSFFLDLLNAPAVVTQLDAMPNVLLQVKYRLCGFDGQRYAYRASTATFTPPEPDLFVAYDSLSAEMVKGWVEATAAADIDTLQREIEIELATTITEEKELPWIAAGGSGAYLASASPSP
jgi:hypothetical protein